MNLIPDGYIVIEDAVRQILARCAPSSGLRPEHKQFLDKIRKRRKDWEGECRFVHNIRDGEIPPMPMTEDEVAAEHAAMEGEKRYASALAEARDRLRRALAKGELIAQLQLQGTGDLVELNLPQRWYTTNGGWALEDGRFWWPADAREPLWQSDGRPRDDIDGLVLLGDGAFAAWLSQAGSPKEASGETVGPESGTRPPVKISPPVAPVERLSAPTQRRPASIDLYPEYSPRNLAGWFVLRVGSWPKDRPYPNEDEDLAAAGAHFGRLPPRDPFRVIRKEKTPKEWRKPGPRKSR